jgi:hypothetical protein
VKCLSLHQPWATLLVSGAKRVETRAWYLGHRGPLLIHAAKKWDADLAHLAAGPLFRPALEAAGVRFEPTRAASQAGWGLPFGAIIGRVDVVECVPTGQVSRIPSGGDGWAVSGGRVFISDAERAFGDYRAGRFTFLCDNPVRFETPIPYRGFQRLFNAEVPA